MGQSGFGEHLSYRDASNLDTKIKLIVDNNSSLLLLLLLLLIVSMYLLHLNTDYAKFL